jgi:hypothetical protein
MNKSPINFGAFAAIAGGLRARRGRGRLGGRINKLENQMAVLMRDRNTNANDMNEPEFDVATESQPGSLQAPIQEDVLTPMNAFSPGTMGVANAMFGSKIPGSFDRDLGN